MNRVSRCSLLVLAILHQTNARKYKYMSYGDTRDEMLNLQKLYPNLVKVDTAQNKWGVASPGNCAPYGICEQYFAQITNFDTLDSERPEVFFSGCVHGDEQVGPTTTVEFIKMLAENYVKGNNTWLKRMVDTRSVVIMPNANAIGYNSRTRRENGYDPNRDFPYGQYPLSGTKDCMKTTAARAINEMYRDHLFQLALTFHGGMKAIAYEWGSPNHPRGKDVSPDHGGMAPLGNLLKQYASQTYYPEGTLNSIVYPVTGGMEDWAYAASWDSGYTPKCKPTTFGGYPIEKTTYKPDMLRAFNILIETANQKKPSESSLGSSEAVLQAKNSQYDGHIPRNLRICLAMTDLVQPYVEWMASPSVETMLDVGQSVRFDWDVGGAIDVDKTQVMVSVIEEGIDCPSKIISGDFITNQTFNDEKFSSSNHKTMWHHLVQNEVVPQSDDPLSNAWVPYEKRYGVQFDLPSGFEGKRVVVAVLAEVDGAWETPGTQFYPQGMHAQSHVIQARTDDTYYAENNGRVIRGQKQWYSKPLCYNVNSNGVDTRHSVQTTTAADSSTTAPSPLPTSVPTQTPAMAPTATPSPVPTLTPSSAPSPSTSTAKPVDSTVETRDDTTSVAHDATTEIAKTSPPFETSQESQVTETSVPPSSVSPTQVDVETTDTTDSTDATDTTDAETTEKVDMTTTKKVVQTTEKTNGDTTQEVVEPASDLAPKASDPVTEMDTTSEIEDEPSTTEPAVVSDVLKLEADDTTQNTVIALVIIGVIVASVAVYYRIRSSTKTNFKVLMNYDNDEFKGPQPWDPSHQ